MCYFFLDRFGLAPEVTMRQEETIMRDIIRFDRQLGYQRWARKHGVEEPDEEDLADFWANALDIRSIL